MHQTFLILKVFLLTSALLLETTNGQCDSELSNLGSCQGTFSSEQTTVCEACFNAINIDLNLDSCDTVNEKYCSFKDCCGECLTEVQDYWECAVTFSQSIPCQLDNTSASTQCSPCPPKLKALQDCQTRQTQETQATCDACFDTMAIDFAATCQTNNKQYCDFEDCCGACSNEVKDYWECETAWSDSATSTCVFAEEECSASHSLSIGVPVVLTTVAAVFVHLVFAF